LTAAQPERRPALERAASKCFTRFSTDTGLPQNSFYAILQTRDGFLWFTTLDGLLRHDGLSFTVFNTANSPGLEVSRMTALAEDAEGALWIGSEDGRVIRYSGGAFRTYECVGFGPNPIIALRQGSDGAVYAMARGAILRCDGERLERFDIPGFEI